MTARILDGKMVANTLQAKIAERVQDRLKKQQRVPGLAVIIVGDDPASKIYVQNKRIACEKLGFYSVAHDLPATVSQQTLEDLIAQLNEDKEIDGIIVQTPLPKHLDAWRIVERIRYDKDVDGFHPYNIGRLTLRRPLLRPCTPHGIIQLLKYYKIDLAGLNAVIVGASNIVGRPMALELLLHKATVTVCHKYTKDLPSQVAQAELLIVAVGNPSIISAEWIKGEAIVVDVGINRRADGSIRGDIDFDQAKEKAAWITPVPGGVGPMTVTMLLENTLYATEHLHS
jgi:methylenetetrahydrofolate dehydrogenase (NADP+)/methenyltetrahydrofolate cyclohydrolase